MTYLDADSGRRNSVGRRNYYADHDKRSAGRLGTGHARVVLVQCAAELATKVLGQPNYTLSSDRELRFGNRGSLAVAIEGPKAGLWYDHENSEGGDLIDLIRRQFGGSFKDAIGYAQRFAGLAPQQNSSRSPRSAANRPLSDDFRTKQALELLRQAGPINNTDARSI
jgi:putative DNA primase/helicase